MIFDVPQHLENKGGIYKISNNIDNKIYIGRTNCFKKRFEQHCKNIKYGRQCNRNIYFFAKEYGTDALIFSIIEECSDLASLKEREEYFIKKFDTVRKGYNLIKNDEDFIKRYRKLGKKANWRLKEGVGKKWRK